MFQRIVVPLDGAKHAEGALPLATAFGRLVGAPLHLVEVLEPWLAATGTPARAAEEDAAARQYLARAVARLTRDGVTATTAVRQGSPADEIVALTGPGDLIVMSPHGRSGAVRWFMGSVAEAVTRRAPAPVLIVRPGLASLE